ncbi:lysine-specific demethylase JMJ17 isoform X3 [Physcomitrium patens]|uniref:lysine-specific demethylase JMJ17 isoform X3 n=1 Tax=Physcomitrium patens TaxID=3218 RepID=UPI003CCE1B10
MGRGRQRIENPPWRQKPGSGGDGSFSALGLEEGPVFYPTEEEFRDPLQFIAQIREQSEPYGICRIVPPESWKPPFAIESESFIFPTKHQSIHQLQERTAACDRDTFKLEYSRYLEREGRQLEAWPVLDGEALDLCKLYNAVKRHGGYNNVRDEKKWAEVFRMVRDDSLQAPVATDSVLACLREVYESHLHGYEVHQANVSAGKLLRMSKSRGMDKTKHVGRKRQGEEEQQEEMQGGKRRKSGEGVEVVAVESAGVTAAGMEEQRVDQICEQCHSGAYEKSMLLCDRCNRGWHLYCLSPPLSAIPHGNWYCLECLASENDSFGFAQGKEYSYESFQRFADRFRRKWFASRSSPPSNSDVEADFWRIVERGTDPVEVLYGSDIDTGLYGSGFPRASDRVPHGFKAEVWEEYVKDPWNLNNFPKLEDSMLRMVQDDIPGVIVPWLYMGMMFSSFCWHYEDHCFYSINYLHRGAPKTWYSVPGSAATEFEQVMQKSFPDLFEAQPDLLFQLVTMLNPTVLRDSNVPVCTTTQEAGHFVITFPRSYHGGFNHGFNCAEAVNFAPADWLPMGGFAVERYRLYHKRAVISHDELLCVVAKNKISAEAKPYVRNELVAIIKKERAHREQLWANGVVRSARMPPRACENHISTEEDPMCIICRYYLHLSAVVCSCRPSKAVCLQHARQLCECPAEQQMLLYRHSLAELDDLLVEKESAVDIKVLGRVLRQTDLAEKWLEKVQRVSHASPTIEFLESVLRDAEQFLWGGHEMDEVRKVERKLAAARRWADEVAECAVSVNDGRVPKVTFRVLERLVGTEPVPCIESNLAFVKMLYEDAKRMREKITGFVLTEPCLQSSSLEALIKEAGMFPVEFAELSRLQQLVDMAKLWSERVRKLLPPIKALRSRKLVSLEELLFLQQQGLALPVKMEDKEILDMVILRAEALQEKVKASLGSSLSLEEMEKIVEVVQELPVQLAGLQELEQGVADARAWVLRVRTTLTLIQHYDYNTSVDLLTELLASTSNRWAQLEVVESVESALKKVRWLESAAKVVEEEPSTDKLVELLKEASRLELSDEKLVMRTQELASTALSWESKAAQVLKVGDSYANVDELLRCAVNIKARLEGLSAVKELHGAASCWKGRAQAYVDKRMKRGEASGDGLSFCTLQALVGEARKLRLHVEESGVLEAYLTEAEGWMARVAEWMPRVRAALAGSEGSELEHSGDTEHRRGVLRELEEVAMKVKSALEAGSELGLDLSLMSELETVFRVNAWCIRALHLLDERPELEVAKSVLEEGLRFSVKTRAAIYLEGAVCRAETWKSRVEMVVPSYGIAGSCSRQQLEQLVSDAKGLEIAVASEEAYIESALRFHSLWQKRVGEALGRNGGHLTRQELVDLQEDSVARWVECGEKEQICAILGDMDVWLSRCRDAIGGPTTESRMELKEMLCRMRESVARALQRVEGEELNCVCGEVLHKTDASMLHCDSCDDWYHPSCLGLSATQARVQKQYICAYCSALSSGVLSVNENSQSKFHVTRRPCSSTIVKLLECASSIPCRMEEAVIMVDVMRMLEVWRQMVDDIVEPALVQRSHSVVVNLCSLLRALKAVEGMEVQEESSLRLRLAIKSNAWRNRAMILLDGVEKPSLGYVTKSIEEAAGVPMSEEDCILHDLRVQEALAVDWIEAARQVMGDEGVASLEDVEDLIAEGERLSVSVSEELSGLRRRSVVYCICRKPYDEEEAMIACDQCREWYHYGCLGLAEPERSEGGSLGELENAEYVCPDCEQSQHVGVAEAHGMEIPCMTSKTLEFYDKETEDNGCGSEAPPAPVTPETPKETEVPQAGLRGKRSSRGKAKAVMQPKWQLSHVLTNDENNNSSSSSSSSEAETPTSGRPCRRTAGRHSGFDNYVLLMRTR